LSSAARELVESAEQRRALGIAAQMPGIFQNDEFGAGPCMCRQAPFESRRKMVKRGKGPRI
jgi:hypothetical protein